MRTKILLKEADPPTGITSWRTCRIRPPRPGPDGNPVGPEALQAIFPDALIEQEMSSQRWIPIPEEIREARTCGEPSPIVPAVLAGAGPRHPR